MLFAVFVKTSAIFKVPELIKNNAQEGKFFILVCGFHSQITIL